MSIESVTEELRILRRRIDAQRSNAHTWPTKEEELAADVDRYDRRLLKAAAIMQVKASAGPGREEFLLSDDERVRLEQRLVDAGFDVTAPADKGSQN